MPWLAAETRLRTLFSPIGQSSAPVGSKIAIPALGCLLSTGADMPLIHGRLLSTKAMALVHPQSPAFGTSELFSCPPHRPADDIAPSQGHAVFAGASPMAFYPAGFLSSALAAPQDQGQRAHLLAATRRSGAEEAPRDLHFLAALACAS
jgi:hypothetical protein